MKLGGLMQLLRLYICVNEFGKESANMYRNAGD